MLPNQRRVLWVLINQNRVLWVLTNKNRVLSVLTNQRPSPYLTSESSLSSTCDFFWLSVMNLGSGQYFAIIWNIKKEKPFCLINSWQFSGGLFLHFEQNIPPWPRVTIVVNFDHGGVEVGVGSRVILRSGSVNNSTVKICQRISHFSCTKIARGPIKILEPKLKFNYASL